MMDYFYRIYGLRVQSQIPFPEAQPEKPGEADVRIVFGRVPEFLREAAKKGYGTWTDGFLAAWFRVRDGSGVYVEAGKRIVVELAKEPQMTRLTSLLLSAGMALICLQRGELFFHGSALEIRGQAVLLCGESGAGKSTVAMELLQGGAGFLADDTVRVRPGPAGMLAEPSYPQQKLCRDMALKCGVPLSELRYIDEERDKYARIRRDCYVKEAVKLGKIFLLRKTGADDGQTKMQTERQTVCIGDRKNVDITQADQVYIRSITGQEALETLAAQLYLADTYRHITGIPYPLMEQLLQVAGQAEICEILRPGTGDTVDGIVTKILQIC